MQQDYTNYSDLLNQLTNHRSKTLCFAGAGTSVYTGIAEWKKFISQLNDKLGNKVDPDQLTAINDSPKAASIIYSKCNPKSTFYDAIREIIDEREFDSYGLHSQIIKLFRLIVTSNFDPAFELALTDFNQLTQANGGKELKLNIFELPQFNFNFNDKNLNLIYLHGKYTSNNIIFKAEDYKKYYHTILNPSAKRKNMEVENLLQFLLKDYCFVFVGFSFNDLTFINTLKHYKSLIQKTSAEISPIKEIEYFAFLSEDKIRNTIKYGDITTISIERLIELKIIKKRIDEEFVFTDNVDDILARKNLGIDEHTVNLIRNVKHKLNQNKSRLQVLKELKVKVISYPTGKHKTIVDILRNFNIKPTDTKETIDL